MNDLPLKSVTCCCRGRKCPVISQLDSNTIQIVDDDKNVIKMKNDEFEMAVKTFRDWDKHNRMKS